MIFTINNIQAHALRGFQLNAVAVSANGYHYGVSESFPALIDSGAFHTSISSERMKDIIEDIKNSNNTTLTPVDTVEIYGITGKPTKVPLYVIPQLYLGEMHFTNVAVTVPTSENFDCLIGRSILHRCELTLDPEANNMTFNFKDSLKSSKHKIKGIPCYDKLSQLAEFSS